MKLIILTSSRHGTASRLLEDLNKNPNLNISRVILANAIRSNKIKKLKKILKIGILGALNGIRIRKWYSYNNVEDIEDLCNRLKIDFKKTNYINCSNTQNLFNEVNAELGISLGNGYIGSKIFTIPKYGMINIHTEILPDFQGAHSIIWPIYEKIKYTGFTIHQIDKNIDTGNILYQKRFPIVFFSTLEKTVRNNIEYIRSNLSDSLIEVCKNFKDYSDNSIKQNKRKFYTTPSFWKFLIMIKNNHHFYRMKLKE